jgi:hypothetical protein
MDREKFIEYQRQAAEWQLGVLSGEEEARQRFEQLAIDTFDFIVSNGGDYWRSVYPAINPLTSVRNQNGEVKLSPELTQRWKNWDQEYLEICARSPRLRLRDIMREISESDNASSWPEYERRIADWVDAGDPSAPPPFIDRHGIATPEFFKELRALRQLCGGWLYWNDVVKRVVFAPEAEWQRVRAAQEAAEIKRRREQQESDARLELKAERLAEVIAAARSDTSFWEALRKWELAREAKRPSQPPPASVRSTSGAIILGRLSAERQAILDNPAVDPIFAEFIARVGIPDDPLTVREFVSNLRHEMRRELNMDGMVQWPGGPTAGVSS